MGGSTADRVVLSYPDGLSDWGRDQLETSRYRKYLRRVLGEIAVGDVRAEFVDVGCCGDSLDVPVRVERIELDGREIDSGRVEEKTTIDYETRPGDVDGGWRVQSAGGPRR